MLKKIIVSLFLAFNNIRSHFFHTILSLLGIIIGVAALVSILCLIDGMEEFAKEQITKTTTLKAILVRTEQYNQVDGINIRKESFTYLDPASFKTLEGALKKPAKGYLYNSGARQIRVNGDSLPSAAFCTAAYWFKADQKIQKGRELTETDFKNNSAVAVVSDQFAKKFTERHKLKEIIGQEVLIDSMTLTVVGVRAPDGGKRSEIFYSIALLSEEDLKQNPPQLVIEAENVEDVMSLKADITGWLESNYKKHDFVVSTNDSRVEQATRGFMVFRIVMGLIVGISVLVGGIGVMNVLLISVTERTSEIGVRKAVGANKRDIVLQFLSESVTISFIGSFIGLVLGLLATMAFVPIIKALTQMPFQAAYTMNTLIVVGVLAMVVGIVFGTYPAMRAAKLDPVEAIRRE